MSKLKEYIDKWCDGYAVRGVHVTPLDIYTLIDAYNACLEKKPFEFISKGVYDVLVKCKIPVKECGVGWELDYAEL